MEDCNIFKDAKFGDRFRTRDGRMAVVVRTVCDEETYQHTLFSTKTKLPTYWLFVDNDGINIYGSDGCLSGTKDDNKHIVGKFEDNKSVDNEEIGIKAIRYAQNSNLQHLYEATVEAYKAGYLEAYSNMKR